MREGITGADLDLLLDGGKKFFRVRVKRWDDAAWTNLSALGGGDWVLNIKADGETPDQPATRFSFALLHSADGTSLSPGASSAAENYDALDVFRPLIHPGRDVEIAVAVTAGADPDAGDWVTWLRGQIEDVDWPSLEVVATCLTLDGVLEQRQIEVEEDRSSDEEPTPVEDEIQGLLDRWMGIGAVPLRVIGTPGWEVGRYRPKGSLGQQVLALAQQNAWDLRYRWSEADGDFRLTFYEPPRDKTDPDVELDAAHIVDVPGLQQSRKYVRNAFSVSYVAGNTGKRLVEEGADPVSIEEYGRQFMGIVEDEKSPIDSSVRALALIDLAKNDLARPLADARKEIPFLPWLEVHDLLFVAADGQHYDFDTSWALVGASHQVDAEHGTSTTFDGRGGKPVGMIQGWFRKARPGRRSTDELAAARSLIDFKEIGRTPTTVTYRWRLGSDLEAAWIHDYHRKQPYSDDQWPDGTRPPDTILDDREGEYTVAIPEPGYVGYLQVEGRLADASIGDMERVLLFPADVRADYIAFASITVDQSNGSAKITGWTGDRAKSVSYAYNVGPAASTPAPTEAQAENQGAGADGGGLVTGFSSDFLIDLPPGTVDFGEVIKGLLIAYLNPNGSGADGSAQDHDAPVGFQGERILIGDPDQIAIETILERHFGDEAVSNRALALDAVARDNIIDREIDASKIALLGLNETGIFANLVIEGRVIVDDAIIARHIFVGSLDEIADDVGIVVHGELRNAAGLRYINLDAVGSQPFINSEKFYITAAGNAYFAGELVAASGTFGIITSGYLQGLTDPTHNFIDLSAAGSSPFIKHPSMELRADGSASFAGAITASSFFSTDGLEVRDQNALAASAQYRQSSITLSNLVGGTVTMQAVFAGVNGFEFRDSLYYQFDAPLVVDSGLGPKQWSEGAADSSRPGWRLLETPN